MKLGGYEGVGSRHFSYSTTAAGTVQQDVDIERAATQEKFELDSLRTKSKCELFPRPRRSL